MLGAGAAVFGFKAASPLTTPKENALKDVPCPLPSECSTILTATGFYGTFYTGTTHVPTSYETVIIHPGCTAFAPKYD